MFSKTPDHIRTVNNSPSATLPSTCTADSAVSCVTVFSLQRGVAPDCNNTFSPAAFKTCVILTGGGWCSPAINRWGQQRVWHTGTDWRGNDEWIVFVTVWKLWTLLTFQSGAVAGIKVGLRAVFLLSGHLNFTLLSWWRYKDYLTLNM